MDKLFKRFLVSVLILSLALFVVGCENDDDDDDTTVVVATVSVSPATGTLLEGATQEFTATAADAAGNAIGNVTFVWASSDEAIATVDEDGLCTAVAFGDVTITATYNTIIGSADLTVTMDYPENAMVSMYVTEAPTEDAVVDAMWADVDGLDVSTVVPSVEINVDGHDIWWDGYEGMTIDVNMKSVYTDDDIYFLYTWDDAEDSKTRMAWYYYEHSDPDSSKWLQMGKKYPDEFNMDPAYEDKFTVFWNMSIPNFENIGCANLCHGAKMASNANGEIADIWHWKRDRTGPVSQIDDKWLDDGAENDGNGRHGDTGVGAYSDNKQTLTVDDVEITAPMYWIPGRTDYHWIMQSEIDDGTARLIVNLVDSNWVDEDGTVLDHTLFGYDSDLVIPSLMGIQPGTEGRADVNAWHNWADGEWTLKVKRARATELTAEDVQFTETNTPYWFSIGVMNSAAIAHATPGGMSGTAYPLYIAE
jgi:uncharacterized lipoprotein NlpE involved in copper resistance